MAAQGSNVGLSQEEQGYAKLSMTGSFPLAAFVPGCSFVVRRIIFSLAAKATVSFRVGALLLLLWFAALTTFDERKGKIIFWRHLTFTGTIEKCMSDR